MLKIEHLTVEYNRRAVICDLTFDFLEGGVTAITGASGIGKTTLLHVLAGLHQPSAGKIHSSYRKLSYIFQEPRLFPWMTALENVTTVCNDPKRAAELLDCLLPDSNAKNKYPHELSGGMKQRVSIARAIAYEPDLLLMDEPFHGLDSETREKTAHFLFESLKGKTVLMVTHDVEDTVFCDEILHMKASPVSTLILEKSGRTKSE